MQISSLSIDTISNCFISYSIVYFAFGSENIEADNLVINGNYSFDGGKNITIRNSKLISKDAFWNCENVTVYDSVIVGEYLGWNSKNVTFINCEIETRMSALGRNQIGKGFFFFVGNIIIL